MSDAMNKRDQWVAAMLLGGFTFGGHLRREDYADLRPGNHMDVLRRVTPVMDDGFPMDAARQAVAEWKGLRPLFLGDFHLLLPLSVSASDWCAFQLHRQDLREGFALFFRRHQSPFLTFQADLRQIDPAATYEVTLSAGYQTPPPTRMAGADLRRLAITIDEAPGSVLLRYRKVR